MKFKNSTWRVNEDENLQRTEIQNIMSRAHDSQMDSEIQKSNSP